MLKIYNTLTNKKEEFKPLHSGKVRMYACGPTVYDFAHIGNWKTFIIEDVLRRYLEYKGFEVRYIMNITDVGHLTADDVNQADAGEDKVVSAARKEKKTPQEIADFYTEKFLEDADKLNLKKPNLYPRAAAHIPQMVKMIGELIKKGLAYEKNGNVFYDVEKFSGYGKLSRKKIEDLKNGARLEKHPDKKHPYDFALWLKAPEKHLLKWESPWSLGYPGWHIECSVMAVEYLGETLDIHAGGEDHIFPHHENEIAQAEGATGKKFVNFWIHSRFLLVDGKKMAKSKGNFYTLADIAEKGYDPMAFRLLVLGSHYRSNLNFTWQSMDQARANLDRITEFINNLKDVDSKNGGNIDLKNYENKFEEAMDDDLNTPLALSVVYDLITEVNKLIQVNDVPTDSRDSDRSVGTKNILSFWNKTNGVFGLATPEISPEISQVVKKLADERETARKEKDFAKADELRKAIEKKGYIIEDKKEGYRIKKKVN